MTATAVQSPPGTRPVPPVQWESVRCNLCGGGDASPYRRERLPYFGQMLDFQVVRCRHCGLVYTNPRLSDANAVYLYDDEYSDALIESHARAKMPVFRAALARIDGYLAGGGEAPERRLLDIGCGGGHFLALARERGYGVAGIEPAPAPADYARRHFGLETMTATIEQTVLPAASFSVITAFDVLEHVTDPLAVLTRCAGWLRPGGVMALRFPAAPWQKFKAVVYGCIPGCRRWSFGPAMHLYFFSRATFARLARQAGLEVIAFHLTPMEAGDANPLWNGLKRVSGGLFELIHRLTGWIPGNLEVYCRKPDPARPGEAVGNGR